MVVKHFPNTYRAEQNQQVLSPIEVQTVANQAALSIAERFGVGLGIRRVPPISEFEATTAEARLARALYLANGIHHRYGRHHHEKPVVCYLFGVSLTALRHLGPDGNLTRRQQALIIGIERFAEFKRISPEHHVHRHDNGEKLQLNNVEAAELAVCRCEIGTHRHGGWKHLDFQDNDSLQRFSFANLLAPLLETDDILQYANQHYSLQAS